MGNTVITITGIPEKEPKINKNFVELIFKNKMSDEISKELKPKSTESIYLVVVSRKSWRTFCKENEGNNGYYKIIGEPKASVNRKNIPFITVICRNIMMENTKEKIVANNVANDNLWYKELKLEPIPVKDIIITERVHFETKVVFVKGLEFALKRGKTNPVAVRSLDNGKYSLVIGIKYLVQAKLLSLQYIDAYITDLDHKSFIKKYNILEKKH